MVIINMFPYLFAIIGRNCGRSGIILFNATHPISITIIYWLYGLVVTERWKNGLKGNIRVGGKRMKEVLI